MNTVIPDPETLAKAGLEDVREAVLHLYGVAGAFDRFNREYWPHLMNVEFGHRLHLVKDKAFVQAVEEVYRCGRQTAGTLSRELPEVTNLARFSHLSTFIRHVEGFLRWIPEDQRLLEQCEAARAAHIAAHRSGCECNEWALRAMIQLHRTQLDLLDTVKAELVALRNSERYRTEEGADRELTTVPPESPCYEFRRNVEVWIITWENTTQPLRHLKGFEYIQYLLRHPWQDVDVLALERAVDPQGVGTWADLYGKMTVEELESDGLHVGPLDYAGNDAESVLDRNARTDYKARLKQLHERDADLAKECEEAGDFNDPVRVERARKELESVKEEMEHLAKQIAEASPRKMRSRPAEQARSNVTKAIKAAQRKIAKQIPKLGEHLNKAIKTGFRLSYRPQSPIPWTFD